MKRHLKKFFIPHEENNYHPHILHTKRAIFYSLFFLTLKVLVFLFAMMIPTVVFVMPDILAQEENKLLTLTNNLRIEKGLSTLSPMVPLHVSSDYKASEMSSLHYFSHTSPNGYGLAHFLSAAGYRYDTAGENLAMGFSSAEEIFSSWVNSPTHYANLVDPDYKEFGVAMESGTYNDLDTVYVAQHFGTPKTVPPTHFPESEEKPVQEKGNVAGVAAHSSDPVPVPIPPTPPKPTPKPVATSVPTTPQPQPVAVAVAPVVTDVVVEPVVRQVHLNRENSFLDWKETEKNQTLLFAQVEIVGDVKSATISLNHYSLVLQKTTGDIYEGTLVVSESANSFFKPIIEPSITIIGADGTVLTDVVAWKHVKVISPTPLEKYTRARELSGVSSSVFDFSRGVYLFGIAFFSLALLLSIIVEIRRQHHHIIVQTLGLIVLLTTLFLI